MTPLLNPEVRRKFISARTAMVLDEPFFGTLALRLTLVEDPSAPTAWTDGQSLGYNPAFISTLTHPQLIGLIEHEVMHCASGHPWRRDAREPRRWNEACDRAINPVLREAGVELPKGALYEIDPTHLGKSAEWIFDRLPVPPEQQPAPQGSGEGEGGGGGKSSGQPQPDDSNGEEGDGEREGQSDGQSDDSDSSAAPDDTTAQQSSSTAPNPLGEVRDAPAAVPDTESPPPSEEDWRQAVQQAAQLAKAHGQLPGALNRFADKEAEPKVDWRSSLRRFAQDAARADYSFARPNRRYVASGWYLPSLHNEEVGVLAVAVDTSGSIDAVLLAQFGGEIRAIADEVKPREIHVLYCDAAVHRTDVFLRGDPVVLNPCGGGGTDFRPVFDALEKFDEPPVALIYLTDLWGTFPEQEPAVPTLWVTGPGGGRGVPFGELITAE